MNRIHLAAQLLGALIFVVAAAAIGNPFPQEFQKDNYNLSVIRVPGKLEFPNLTAKPGRQAIQVDLDWTASLGPFLKAATAGEDLSKRKIVLRVGEKRYQLRGCIITGIEWPEAHFNPKEISIDKCVGLKMDTEVVDYREGGVNDTTHKRSFGGAFKGEIVGVEPAVIQKVEAFSVKATPGAPGPSRWRGSMKVEISRASAAALGWVGAGVEWAVNPTRTARLTLLDSAKRPLLSSKMLVSRVKRLGFTGADGRSMSFELFFDTYESGTEFRVGPRGGGSD